MWWHIYFGLHGNGKMANSNVLLTAPVRPPEPNQALAAPGALSRRDFF